MNKNKVLRINPPRRMHGAAAPVAREIRVACDHVFPRNVCLPEVCRRLMRAGNPRRPLPGDTPLQDESAK